MDTHLTTKATFHPTQVFSIDIGDGDYIEMEFEDFVDQMHHVCTTEVCNGGSEGDESHDVHPLLPKLIRKKGSHLQGSCLQTPLTTNQPHVQPDVQVKGKPFNLLGLKPFFIWQPIDVIKKTIKHTTQFGH